MVMSLPLPADCSLNLVDEVVAERQAGRHAARFLGWQTGWRARVQAYLDHGGSPEHVRTWSAVAPHAATFHNLYNSRKPGTAHGDMLGRLRDHELRLCPACGELGRPNTLDHYLPKATYPHFSITPANLFPMCDACQQEKGTKTGSAAEPRFFLHPYFDAFTATRILKLTIVPPFAAPTFALEPDGVGRAEAAIITAHVRELNISGRYVKFFKDEYRRLLRNVARMRDKDQDVVATLETWAFDAADPTENSWQHLFYNGVLSNPELVDYLTDGDLPPLL